MTVMLTITAEMELRKVPRTALLPLYRILEINNGWKALMAHIPKYKQEHIGLVEEAARGGDRTGAQILVEEWSTSGQRGVDRPTVGHLLEALQAAVLYRAADRLAADLLGEGPVPRPPSGPAAAVDTTLPDGLDPNLERNEPRRPQRRKKQQPRPPSPDRFQTSQPDLSILQMNIPDHAQSSFQTTSPNLSMLQKEIQHDTELFQTDPPDLSQLQIDVSSEFETTSN